MDINREKIEKYTQMIQKHGTLWLIIGKATPSVKVFVPIVAGVAKISRLRAIAIFFLGSLIWAAGITYLGYHFGQRLDLAEFYGFYFLFVFAISLGFSVLYHFKKLKK